MVPGLSDHTKVLDTSVGIVMLDPAMMLFFPPEMVLFLIPKMIPPLAVFLSPQRMRPSSGEG